MYMTWYALFFIAFHRNTNEWSVSQQHVELYMVTMMTMSQTLGCIAHSCADVISRTYQGLDCPTWLLYLTYMVFRILASTQTNILF